MKTFSLRLAVALLFAAVAFQALASARAHSPTADEFAHHIASGYSYWRTGDFRMNPASPPLPRMLAALPLLFLGAKAPLEHPSWAAGDSPEFARQFFYVANHRADEFIFWARVPTLLLSLAFGACLYVWTRKRMGEAAALGALALYAFCPDILAHSSLATADLAVAFFFFLTVISFAKWLDAPTASRAAGTAALAALAFLCKFSAVMLFPCLLGIALLSRRLHALHVRHLLLALGMFFVTVWAGYGFEVKPLLKNTPSPEKKEAVYRRIGGEALADFAKNVPVPLSTFSSAFVAMMHTRAQGTNAFLLGEWSTRGWWYYYFVAFAVKNTLPFLALLLIGLVRIRHETEDPVLIWTLFFPPLLFFLSTMPDRAQAGIRYFLPIYPFFFAAAGVAFARFWKWRRGRLAALGAALLLWHALEALSVAPHSLAYFNELAGGPRNGYKVLRDSNLDWGQGLKTLAKKVRQKNYGRIVLDYPWPADPASYGIDYRPMTGSERDQPQNEVYAVSAHALDARWARELRPTDHAGYAILIYDLRKK